MKKSLLTNEEIKAIVSRPFEIWPACKCSYCEQRDFKRGPTPDQRKVFEIPHKHKYDICLAYGGRRGSKSAAAIAKGIWFALSHPGCTILVGAKTLELLKRTAYKYWKERFTVKTAWDHPLIKRAPTDLNHNKCLELWNGTQIWFLHFEEFEVLRGIGITFAHIEEGSLLSGEDSMQEIARSLSETLAIQNQLIITTNPEESKGWIHRSFSLKQFEPGYKGDPIPIGQNCTCQFCPTCIAERISEDSNETHKIPWVEGIDRKGRKAFVCSRCPSFTVEDDNGKMIPRQTIKDNDCPGDQSYMRVVFFDPIRNPHTPSAYREMTRQITSKEKFELYTEGKVVELRQGKAYFHYSMENMHSNDIPLDYSKDLFWSFDFNVPRQCSVICQERETESGTFVDVIDEIVIANAGPVEIAKEFLYRYQSYKKDIYMYGDPAAMNNKISANDLSQFQIIYNIITDPFKRDKHGELVNLTEEDLERMPNLVAKSVKLVPVKVVGQTKMYVVPRVDSLNDKLCNSAQIRSLMVNPKCEWLLTSLEDMRWKEVVGRPQLDTTVDKADAKNPDKSAVRCVSHITDALGYYVGKKWPIIKNVNSSYVVVPGETTIELQGNQVIEQTIQSSPPVEETDIDKKIREIEELNLKIRSTPANKGSVLEILQGSWGRESELFNYYDL